MNKKYLLLFVCGLLLSFTNAMAAVGNGVIKIKTNASKGQKIKMEMFIFGGWDEDGDALDNSPVYGDNFSVDGASNVTAAGNKVFMTADGPEITIHGDVDYLSTETEGVLGKQLQGTRHRQSGKHPEAHGNIAAGNTDCGARPEQQP